MGLKDNLSELKSSVIIVSKTRHSSLAIHSSQIHVPHLYISVVTASGEVMCVKKILGDLTRLVRAPVEQR